MANDLVTTGEAARRLGVSMSTVQRMVRDGHLPAWTAPGGHLRIRGGDLDAWLGRHVPQEEPS